MRYFGLLLLSVWLCLDGAKTIFRIYFPYDHWIIPGFALFAGIVLLLNSFRNFFGNLGLGLLGIWLILFSTLKIFRYALPYNDMTLAILGFATAFFILIKK